MNPKKLTDYPDFLSVHDICILLKIGRHTVYEMLKTHQLKARKIGRSYRIRKSDLEQMFRSN